MEKNTKPSAKPRVFSGIQPSGSLHIGNYLGAISQWVKMQDDYACVYCVVDYHAITVQQDPKTLKRNILDIARIYLASGIDPKKSIIFQQSDIKEHTELAWVLNCISKMSDLFKMTQFKDKTQVDFEKIIGEINKRVIKNAETHIVSSKIDKMIEELKSSLENIRKSSVGLFDYPVLMAADILLYNTNVVPVGEDQVQHVELTRDLAKRFNHQYGDSFCLPKAKILSAGARIMGLDDPTKKMSKSASSEYNYISLTEDPKKAAKKIMRATTDSGAEVKFDINKKAGISNLLTVYSILEDVKIKDLEAKYKGKGYGDFKKDLAAAVEKFLAAFQKKYNSYSDRQVRSVLDAGAQTVQPIAAETMGRVREKLGIE